MYYSIFDLFKIGIGPSSSHTVGPINASIKFLKSLFSKEDITRIKSINIELFGSLAFTGHGHKTIEGIIIGLMGIKPENINDNSISLCRKNIDRKELLVNEKFAVSFNVDNCIIFNKTQQTNKFSNKLKYTCVFNDNKTYEKIYYSIGGGSVIEKGNKDKSISHSVPYTFTSGKDLLDLCTKNDLNIHDIVLQNERSISNDSYDIESKILNIWDVMNNTINAGMNKDGFIDDILKVERRAQSLYNKLKSQNKYDPLEVIDWVNIFAISTCEENASGSKVVTAPTNGAAGIIPSVIKYYQKFVNESNNEGIIKFFATSSAIGSLYKINSSISGADVGCQGEVGVACSMAAAGLTSALGGTPSQIENAAEIGMEHNLGLTCDPIKGLVQIPCIERNSMGAIKAINASRLALSGTGRHKVTLDQVIKTMKDTGDSMSTIYKETSLGGLAVNVVEC